MASEIAERIPRINIFEDAIKSFITNVSPDVLNHFQDIVSLDHLKIAISDIEREQAARRSFRNLKKIDPFLNGLRDYAAVIEVFVNAKPDIMAFIWGPIKFCLQVASKYSHAFDSLLGAYAKIRDSLPNFVLIEQLYASQHDAITPLLLHVYTDILTFHKRAIQFFSKPGWKIAIKMTCRALDDCFGDILRNLQYSQKLLYTGTDLAHYHESHEARIRTEQAFIEQQEREKQGRRLRVHAWLDAFSHKNQQHDLQTVRGQYPGTCTWLFKNRCWIDWVTRPVNDRQGLWIYGIPGAGKTVLFSAMVNELQTRTTQSHGSSLVVYVYCKYNDSSRDNFTVLARSLINTLLGHNDTAYDYMYDVAVNSTEQVPTTRDILSTCILDLIQFHEQVYLGIDGLDEIEPQERMLMVQLVQKLLAMPTDDHRPSVFLTSRPEHDLEKAFSSLSRIKLDRSRVTPDIKTYAQIRINELKCFEADERVLRGLMQAIVDRSEDMFLLAKLTFDLFCECSNKEEFREQFENRKLPAGVEEAYQRILERISAREKVARCPKAARVLEILTFARRTLYMHELQTALSINTERKDIDFENRRYMQPFKQICGTLIEVNSDDSVTLVHTTAKKFLAETTHGLFDKTRANLQIARLCTVYLSMDIFCHNNASAMIEAAILQGCFGLYRYAFCNWIDHATSVVNSSLYHEEELCSFLTEINDVVEKQSLMNSKAIAANDPLTCEPENLQQTLETLDAVRKALEGVRSDSNEKMGTVSFDKAVHHMTKIQDDTELMILTAQSTELTRKLSLAYGNKPFLCPNIGCSKFYEGFKTKSERNAHSKTHERPYKCSFNGCIFNSTGFSNRKALQKHIDVFHVEDLSLRFSQLQARTPEQRLSDAIDEDDIETVERLCSQQTELGHYPPEPWKLAIKALGSNAGHSAMPIVKYLGPRIFGEQNPKGVTSFLTAVVSVDDLEPVRMALSTLDKTFWNCHQYRVVRHVIRRCQPSVLELLIECLASIGHHHSTDSGTKILLENESPFEMCKTMLKFPDTFNIKGHLRYICTRAATGGRHLDLVKLLLPMANLETEFRGSHWQVMRDASTLEEKVICLQQARDAEVKAEQTAAFFQAVQKNHLRKVEKFLSVEFDIESTGAGYGCTALILAAKRGFLQLVQCLVKKGANLEASAGHYGTPVCAAASNGHLEIVSFLIENGAEFVAGNNVHDNPLCAAARARHLSIVQYLVKQGAKLEAGKDYYPMIFYTAATEGFLEMMELVIDTGVEIDTFCGTFSGLHLSPLLQATRWLQLDAVGWLLSHGADVNWENSSGWSALHMALSPLKSCDERIDQFCLPVIESLLAAGADPNSNSGTDKSVLGVFVRSSKTRWSAELAQDILQVLVDHGLDCSKPYEHGRSILAEWDGSDGVLPDELWYMLVDNGADIDMKDPDGISAREWLEKWNPETLKHFGFEPRQTDEVLQRHETNEPENKYDDCVDSVMQGMKEEIQDEFMTSSVGVSDSNATVEDAWAWFDTTRYPWYESECTTLDPSLSFNPWVEEHSRMMESQKTYIEPSMIASYTTQHDETDEMYDG